jgi:hypothetical protein
MASLLYILYYKIKNMSQNLSEIISKNGTINQAFFQTFCIKYLMYIFKNRLVSHFQFLELKGNSCLTMAQLVFFFPLKTFLEWIVI